MKNNLVKIIGGLVLAISVISALTFLAPAQSDFGSQTGGRLEGTWDSQVTIRNCQTGAASRTFASIGTFMVGGTFLDSTSGTAQALKTPGQGVWTYTGGNTYRFKFKSFTFDASGNFTGWTIISHEAHLNARADEYESAGTLEVYSPNGALVFSGCSTTTAVRFK